MTEDDEVPPKVKRVDYIDINYSVVANVTEEMVMEFKVYKIVWESDKAYTMDFKVYKIVWESDKAYIMDFSVAPALTWEKSSGYGCVPTADIGEANIEFEGFVRCDGCTNVQLQCGPTMFHACSKKHLTDVGVGVLLGRVYDLAAEMLETNWCGE